MERFQISNRAMVLVVRHTARTADRLDLRFDSTRSVDIWDMADIRKGQ
jgi:hypothetical protein